MTYFNKPYSPPDLEEFPAFIADLLCSSPEVGTNEGVTYEDWTL